MKAVFAALSLLAACEVYDASLLVSSDASVDGSPESCATMCSGQCADLTSDKNNCGACGVACETGCSGGLCTPTVLVSGLGGPHGILVHGSELYVADHASIAVQEMSKIDGTGLKNFATSQLFPDRLATDNTNLYWTDDANISTSPGGTIEFGNFDQTTDCAINGDAGFLYCYNLQYLPSPYGIAVQGTNTFVTTLDGTNNGPAPCAGLYVNAVVQCPTFGCNIANCTGSGGPNVIATGTKLASITADATNVYWADTGAHVINFCPQPSCTGGPKAFAQNLAEPFDVVSDGTNVLFTDRGSGTLYKCPTSGCNNAPTILTSSLTDPLLVAFDSKNAYVTSYSGGTIASCDMPSCASGVKIIAKGLKAPYGVALDDTYVYWSEEGSNGGINQDGAVSKLKRQ